MAYDLSQMLAVVVTVSVMIGMFSTGLSNGVFMHEGAVVFFVLREMMADTEVLQESYHPVVAWVGGNVIVWSLTNPLLSFPRRGGLNSDTVVPMDSLPGVLATVASQVGQLPPIGERVRFIEPATAGALLRCSEIIAKHAVHADWSNSPVKLDPKCSKRAMT